ncbi:hydroxylase [Mycolicibacterium sp. 018/SC-01/001]|nr:hydroxylase [Mycolicibacterium sp. 018/SC-01/001]
MNRLFHPGRVVFDRIVRTRVPTHTQRLFDTACVLGGSVAGLLAARVLADHATTVLILERDDADEPPRTGVPQDRQGHVLLPGGHMQIEKWLPGFSGDLQDQGAVLVESKHQAVYLDGRPRLPNRDLPILSATRPFLEAAIRSRVLAYPNVSALPARVTGLEFDNDEVCAVRYETDDGPRVLAAEFVVDAMGRSSKAAGWVERAGFQRPIEQRLRSDINYATALFKRSDDVAEHPLTTLALFTSPGAPDAVALGAALAAERDQWMVMLTAYEPDRPPASLEQFRATCAKLPPVFAHAAKGLLTREIRTYRQADSRRRDFTALQHFPARLVSVGDAVASFNPIHGQGMSSAALHGNCLSMYLSSGPRLSQAATQFFHLQSVVTDAAWALSTGPDAARLDALHGNEVASDVAQQRWNFDQVLQATLHDQSVADVYTAVSFMAAHPSLLVEPALVERAVRANERSSTP